MAKTKIENSKNSKDLHKHFFHKNLPLKKTLYLVFVSTAVISFWRGLWGIMDIYLFPDNYELSLWVSLIFAVIALQLTHHLNKIT
jgi:hypothetical protein